MNKPVIGIITQRNLVENRPFKLSFSFNDSYSKMVVNAGGIPVGVFFPGGEFNTDILDICDGFIFQGGSQIDASQVNAVHYALSREKPILGICLGFQTMAAYEWLRGEFGCSPTYSEISDFFKPEDEVNFLKKIQGHNNLDPFYLSDINKSKHEILLSPSSILANIFDDDYLLMPSVHNWCVQDKVFLSPREHIFKIVGRSIDNNIEALESNIDNWWAVGVQFHPELEDENLVLFQNLVNEAKVKKIRR